MLCRPQAIQADPEIEAKVRPRILVGQIVNRIRNEFPPAGPAKRADSARHMPGRCDQQPNLTCRGIGQFECNGRIVDGIAGTVVDRQSC